MQCIKNSEEEEPKSSIAETVESKLPESKAESKKEEPVSEKASTELSGKLTMAGSTSMEKLANAFAEVFMENMEEGRYDKSFKGKKVQEKERGM